jgi:hypothetical protein
LSVVIDAVGAGQIELEHGWVPSGSVVSDAVGAGHNDLEHAWVPSGLPLPSVVIDAVGAGHNDVEHARVPSVHASSVLAARVRGVPCEYVVSCSASPRGGFARPRRRHGLETDDTLSVVPEQVPHSPATATLCAALTVHHNGDAKSVDPVIVHDTRELAICIVDGLEAGGYALPGCGDLFIFDFCHDICKLLSVRVQIEDSVVRSLVSATLVLVLSTELPAIRAEIIAFPRFEDRCEAWHIAARTTVESFCELLRAHCPHSLRPCD